MVRVYYNLMVMMRKFLVKITLKSLGGGNEEKHLYFNLYDVH
jgi:hypothetical protein